MAARATQALLTLTAALMLACRDDGAVSPGADETTEFNRTDILPSGGFSLATDVAPLSAAAVRADSASIPIRVATVELVGEAGDTVALMLRADAAVLAAAGEHARLLVGRDSFPLGAMGDGVVVYRFESAGKATLTVGLTRRVQRVVSGVFALNLYTSATVTNSSRAALTGGDPEECSLSSATGTCDPSNWSISPYFTPTVFCGTDCFTSQPNTGQSLPVTVTFSPAIASITVTIQDPTWAGNTMTAYAPDGSTIGTVEFAYSGVPGANVPDTKQLSGVIDHVVLTPPEGDYVAYVAGVTPYPVGISVSCGAPVVRGGTISCTASPLTSGDALIVTGWSFRDSTPQNLVRRQSNVGSTSWAGTMAVRGTVLVEGTINGTPSSGSAQVQVNARSWTSAMKTQKSHSVIATQHSSTPTAFSELGSASLNLPLDMNVGRWLANISDDGPNAGYAYVLDLPPITTTVSQVNTKAIRDTSAFYRVQESRRKKIGADWFCARSVVWPGVLLNLSIKHEGAVSPYPQPDTLPNSHPGIYRRHVDSLAYLRFEPIVSFGPEDNVSPVASALALQAANDSHSMDTSASRNYINTTSLGGCDHFHFGPYP